MKGPWRRWKERFLGRFRERVDLGRKEIYERFWSDLPQEKIMELFNFLEIEYDLPPGLVRPTDSIELIVNAVATGNLLKWVFYQSRAEDTMVELRRQVEKRAPRGETSQVWSSITTVDDLARAWCGASLRDSR